ncbi:MAG: hypothetical protein A3G41_03965 [Elusimicrobia bacterium RIFCSPLOWO2_12_FULL_59_9]|nr:MAG: hypothetical protein A3G41_03965 [Elusimicrobia bacterium RIFCSPLOWO2_12_FULL_59_9]
MPQYYVAPEDIAGGQAVLRGPEARHLASVLRKRAGDEIRLFDKQGNLYRAQITRISEKILTVRLLEVRREPLPALDLTLYQALIAKSKFEDVLEKGTELGIQSFVPLVTGRTQIRLKPERLDAQLSRWNRIALAALKQSGRTHAARVLAPMSFPDALRKINGEPALIGWEKEKSLDFHAAWRSLPEARRTKIHLVIGPEGGFTEEEASLALRAGAVPFTFGSGILRSETAALAASSLILFGDQASP